jgi:hypothetical protein
VGWSKSGDKLASDLTGFDYILYDADNLHGLAGRVKRETKVFTMRRSAWSLRETLCFVVMPFRRVLWTNHFSRLKTPVFRTSATMQGSADSFFPRSFRTPPT